MGKHNQGLYFKGRRFYATSLGGIMTMVIALIVLSFTVSTLTSIFRKEQYIITYHLKTMKDSSFLEEFKNIYQFETYFWKNFFVTLDPDYHTKCDEMEIVVRLSTLSNEMPVIVEETFELDQISTSQDVNCWFITNYESEFAKSKYQKWLKQFTNTSAFYYYDESKQLYYNLEYRFQSKNLSIPLSIKLATLTF